MEDGVDFFEVFDESRETGFAQVIKNILQKNKDKLQKIFSKDDRLLNYDVEETVVVQKEKEGKCRYISTAIKATSGERFIVDVIIDEALKGNSVDECIKRIVNILPIDMDSTVEAVQKANQWDILVDKMSVKNVTVGVA